MKIKITFTEELLGTASGDHNIHGVFIASKAPDAASREEEVAALGVEEVIEKSMTVFPRDEDGRPFLWDYQVKGFFKDAAGMLGRAKGTKSSGLTAFKKVIDGLVFVSPRQIPLILPKGAFVGPKPWYIGSVRFPIHTTEVDGCQRPLRAQTAQGERIALAHSETVPAGTTIEIDVTVFEMKEKEVKAKSDDKEKKAKAKPSVLLSDCLMEWLEYGALRGIGQWRNSGKGRFAWEKIGE